MRIITYSIFIYIGQRAASSAGRRNHNVPLLLQMATTG